MPDHKYHRYFHGILLPDFLEFLGIEPTAEAVQVTKKLLKGHHKVPHVSGLTDEEYIIFIREVKNTLANEWGFETRNDRDQSLQDMWKCIYGVPKPENNDTNERRTKTEG